MKSRILSALVLLGLMSCGDTATEPVATASKPLAVEPTPPSMRPDASPEVLSAIQAREAGRAARALAEVEQRFATRTPGLELRVRRVKTDSLGDTHVWIQQVFQGTPVVGRDLGVIISLDEQLKVLGTPDDFRDVKAPKLTVAAGLARARAHGKTGGLALKADAAAEGLLEPVYERRLKAGASGQNAADYETVVVGFERGVRVGLGTPTSPEAPRELFVRERDGAVLERAKPRRAYANATLRSRYAGTVTSLPTHHDLANETYSLTSHSFDKVSWTQSPDATPEYLYTHSVNDWGDGQFYTGGSPSKTNGQTAAADAYISIYGIHRMWSDIYLQDSWDGSGSPIEAIVHYPDANAYAIGGGIIWLGYMYDASAPNNLSNKPLTDIEIVGHEVGHMAFEDMIGYVHPYDSGELAGMDEGTADIFGLVAGFYLPDALAPVSGCGGRICGSGTRRPITVRNDWVGGNGVDSRYGRSFIDPHQFPAWEPGIKTAPGQYAAGPLLRMFYFLSVGVLEAGKLPAVGLTKPQRASPYLPKGMTGLGIDTANWLWYHTLSSIYFSRISGYHDAREMMLEATTSVYGHKRHTPQYKAVEDAWAAVNVGPPADRTAPEITIDTQQTSPTEGTVTVDVTDDNGISSGTVVIRSALNGYTLTRDCLGHCVIAFNPTDYGTHAGHTVKVTAKDMRENEMSQQTTFSLDVTLPAVTLTSNTSVGITAPKQDWNYRATDASGIKRAKVLVDGAVHLERSWEAQPVLGFTIHNVVVDVSALPERAYPVRFETTDRFGNTDVKNFSLVADRTPPEHCALTATQSQVYPNGVDLFLFARDNLSGLSSVQYRWADGSLIASYETPREGGSPAIRDHFVTVAPGTHTFYATCQDRNSNLAVGEPKTVTLLPSCNTTAVAGGSQVDERAFAMGKTSGTVTLRYQTYGAHDRIKVYSGTTLVADTGCTATSDDRSVFLTKTFTYSGTTGQLKARVEPNCDPSTANPGTEWAYSLSCP